MARPTSSAFRRSSPGSTVAWRSARSAPCSTTTAPAASADGTWEQLRGELLEAVAGLPSGRWTMPTTAPWPSTRRRPLCPTCCCRCWTSWSSAGRSQFGAALEQVFCLSWLRSKLGAAGLPQQPPAAGRAGAAGQPLRTADLEPGLWLCAWLLSTASCPVRGARLDGADQRAEPGRRATSAPRALLLYSSQAPGRHPVAPPVAAPAEACAVPLLLAGPAGTIHHDELQLRRASTLPPTPPGRTPPARTGLWLEDARCAS